MTAEENLGAPACNYSRATSPKEAAPGFPLDKATQARRVWECRAGCAACTRKDPCRSCLGRRSRRKGADKQREASKALGVPTRRYASQNSHEENWTDPRFVDEVKSGAQVSPVATRFLAYEKQVLQNKRIGDQRQPRITVMPPGWGNDGIVMLRLSVWNSVILPLIGGES